VQPGSARAGAAPVIQQRNQRKGALEDFAKEYNIKPESIKKAYKRFQETDVDHSGLIDYTEFCEILQVDASPQVERLFQMFDKDRSGQIDVKEFMIGLSNFTGAGKEEKLKFAFMVFDEDGNGVITKQELLKILKANHMASSDSEVIRKAETIMMQVQPCCRAHRLCSFHAVHPLSVVECAGCELDAMHCRLTRTVTVSSALMSSSLCPRSSRTSCSRLTRSASGSHKRWVYNFRCRPSSSL
jgi:Ca2+-binding EF-hand superfamily protein